jgi:hypothetical protein
VRRQVLRVLQVVIRFPEPDLVVGPDQNQAFAEYVQAAVFRFQDLNRKLDLRRQQKTLKNLFLLATNYDLPGRRQACYQSRAFRNA